KLGRSDRERIRFPLPQHLPLHSFPFTAPNEVRPCPIPKIPKVAKAPCLQLVRKPPNGPREHRARHAPTARLLQRIRPANLQPPQPPSGSLRHQGVKAPQRLMMEIAANP